MYKFDEDKSLDEIKKYIDYFDFTGFNILLPLALIIYFWQVSFPQINSIGLIISFFASGIFISMIGFLISKKFFDNNNFSS